MFHTIFDAIEDIKQGKMVIVVDDENRENEGDFIIPAINATPEVVNFMAMHGRGLICAPITESKAKELNLPPMLPISEDSMKTAFTISVDAKTTTTGISAFERSETLKLLASECTANDFVRPGHIFPLIAKEGGVTERPGHTEAAIDLAVLAGFPPVGVICEILNMDGTMARVPDLIHLAKELNLKLITIEDLISFKKHLSCFGDMQDYEQHIRG